VSSACLAASTTEPKPLEQIFHRGRTGFATPLTTSTRGLDHPTQGRYTRSFWEPANLADRPTVSDCAKRYTTSPLRPGRCPDATSALRVPEYTALRPSWSDLTNATATGESTKHQPGRLVRFAGSSTSKVKFRQKGNHFPFFMFAVEGQRTRSIVARSWIVSDLFSVQCGRYAHLGDLARSRHDAHRQVPLAVRLHSMRACCTELLVSMTRVRFFHTTRHVIL